MTYFLIEEIALNAPASSVEFTNIKQDYDDLVLITSPRRDTASNDLICRINNISTGYAGRQFASIGTLSSPSGSTNVSRDGAWVGRTGDNGTSNTFASNNAYFPRYSVSGQHKIVDAVGMDEGNTGARYIIGEGTITTITNNISSLVLVDQAGGSMVAGSRFALYGIKGGFDGITTVS
jgi:hypothetical protein